jgi:hypothetical protein
MIGSIFAQHAPLIRDYPSAPPTPPAPPAPPTPPEPPQAEPIAFAAVTRASLFGIIGSAISSTTLATITCADASMTIRQSEVVAGLTFSYSAGVLTIAGTPTGSTRVQRVVVSYIASDGSNSVRGSTSHEISLASVSEVLTIGPMAGVSGRVGRRLTATLCTPTTNYATDLTAYAQSIVGGVTWVNVIDGMRATLAWTRGVSSGSGVLTLSGVPTQAGTYSLVVNFYDRDARVVGTSTHAVVIAAAYETQPSAPAPAPAPTPPAPSPPPVPSPAPAPGLGPDATLAAVKVLMRFNTATGIAHDERGNTFTNNGGTLADGAVAQGAFLPTRGTISGTVAGLDGVGAGLSVECMVDIGATQWGALTASGGDQRFCPVVSYTSTDGALLWALGFLSRLVDASLPGATPYRRVDAMFWTAVDDAYSLTGSGSAGAGGIITRPAKFVHLAGVLKTYTTLSWERASWLGGEFCLSRVQGLQVAPVARSTGRLQIGGTCAAFRTHDNLYPLTTIVPFSGVVDELRIKAPGQYADLMNTGVPAAITLARRVIPWPNY